MSNDIPSNCVSAEAEPVAARSSAPIWIIVVTLLLIFLGGYYFDQHSGWFDKNIYTPYNSTDKLEAYQPKSDAAAAFARGKTDYDRYCGICHGPDGQGKPGLFPPLAGSEFVNSAGFNRLARIPLAGLSGPVQVNGKSWSAAMPAMGATLPDDSLAAVLTYIRGSWGNKAGPVTADDIKKIRAEIGKSPAPLTADTLKALPE
jgi:mono/diheme cytochrome c family protein